MPAYDRGDACFAGGFYQEFGSAAVKLNVDSIKELRVDGGKYLLAPGCVRHRFRANTAFGLTAERVEDGFGDNGFHGCGCFLPRGIISIVVGTPLNDVRAGGIDGFGLLDHFFDRGGTDA